MSVNWSVSPDCHLELLPLRRFREVFEVIEENRVYLRRWLPWLDRVRKPVDSRPHLEASLKGFARGDGFSLAILIDGTFAGMVGFHAFDEANRITSLGYWLAQSRTGRGYMTRAVARCLDYAFEERRMNRVYIRCASGNWPSRAIPVRLGFRHEGCQREAEWLYDHFVDLEMYSLLQREWRGLPSPIPGQTTSSRHKVQPPPAGRG